MTPILRCMAVRSLHRTKAMRRPTRNEFVVNACFTYQKLKNPATDGLIFEITYHIRRYLYEKPLALVFGMPLPKAKNQLHGLNEVIAKFVNAALQTTAQYSRQDVKVRHDSLERQRTVLVSWDL